MRYRLWVMLHIMDKLWDMGLVARLMGLRVTGKDKMQSQSVKKLEHTKVGHHRHRFLNILIYYWSPLAAKQCKFFRKDGTCPKGDQCTLCVSYLPFTPVSRGTHTSLQHPRTPFPSRKTTTTAPSFACEQEEKGDPNHGISKLIGIEARKQ